MRRILIGVIGTILLPGFALAEPIIIFDGSSSPESQGWIASGSGNIGTVLPGGMYQLDTSGGAETDIALFKKFVGANTNFTMSAYLQVITGGGHNEYDASFALGPFGLGSYYDPIPDPNHGHPGRGSMLYIDPDKFGNNLVINYVEIDKFYASDATDGFHLYRLEVTPTTVNVYLDNVPVLSYDSPAPVVTDGYVFFGDQTNDFGLDAKVKIDYITYEIAPLPVSIDIKPGSDPNCFNVNGHGVIPVAVLGSDSFDVTDVDITTLSFGGLAVRMRGNKGPICGYQDSNSDGIQDLVCQFEDDPSAWNVGSDSATLSGELLDGLPFEGSDSICVVP